MTEDRSTALTRIAPGVGRMFNLAKDDRAALAEMVQSTVAAGVFAADVPAVLVQSAVGLAQIMGLQPALGHVMVFTTRKRARDGQGRDIGWEAQHRLYVTADGWAAWAGQFPTYAGWDWEVLSTQRKADLLIEEKALAIEVSVSRSDWRRPSRAIGVADPDKPHGSRLNTNTHEWEGGNDVERRDPYAMAMARGMRHAVGRAFAINQASIAQAQQGLLAIAQAGEVELQTAGDQLRLAVETQTEPAHLPEDTWRSFWGRVRDHAEGLGLARLTDGRYEMDRELVYDRIEAQAGVSLNREDPDTGQERRSMLAFDGTPSAAWTLLTSSKPDPQSARSPEDVLFGDAAVDAEAEVERPVDVDADGNLVDVAVADAGSNAVPQGPQEAQGADEPPDGVGAPPEAAAAQEAPPGPPDEAAEPKTETAPNEPGEGEGGEILTPDDDMTAQLVRRIKAQESVAGVGRVEIDEIGAAKERGEITDEQYIALRRECRRREQQLHSKGVA